MGQFTNGTTPRPFLFALRRFLTPDLLRHALRFAGRPTRSRVLPAPLVILVLVAGFLHGKLGLPRILAWLGFGGGLAVSDQALYQARQRLGWRPIWWLRRHALGWLAHARRDPTAFYRGRRLLAVDGTTLAVADSPDNTRTFGTARNQHARSGFPLLRLVVLCEIGTRALVRWIARPYHTSEQKMLPRLLPHVPAGALLVADRNFHAWAVWEAARRAGFSVLLRVQSGPRFPVLEAFADGSYRSRVCPRRGRDRTRHAIPVRVIVCRIGIGTRVTTYRLVTNLLDPTDAPAREVVGVYARRWEVETAFAEFKGQLAGRTTPLRCRGPRSVMAELDALLIGYFVVRRLALEAARREEVDPLSMSFRQVVQTVIGVMSRPTREGVWYREAARGRNRRWKRSCPRCRKVVRCAWPVKKPGHQAFRYETAILTIETPSP
jgi:hypothetical protein